MQPTDESDASSASAAKHPPPHGKPPPDRNPSDCRELHESPRSRAHSLAAAVADDRRSEASHHPERQHRKREESAGASQCTAFEKGVLASFGLESARLDRRQTFVDLVGKWVDKPSLAQPVGVLSSGAYADYAKCSWLIAPPGARSITLEFSSFDTEEDYDSVHVYDGTVADEKFLLKTLSGPLRR